MALTVDIEKRLGAFHLRVALETGDQVLSLLGASGCGKSMTLKCIAGIERPDRGQIVLDGRVLFDSEKGINLPPQKRRVGYLFQQYALFPNMTVRQNIAVAVRRREEASRIVEEMIRAMDLAGCENQHPGQLSGGQQQRVALARILVNEPEALLLDEPFSALDSHLRFRLEQEVRGIIRRFGKTVLLVSHDRDEVFRLSDSVAILHAGHLETIGTRDEVFRRPVTRAGAILTGCKNISPIQKQSERRVWAEDWGMELELDQEAGDASFLGIRMHSIRPAAAGEKNIFRCRVDEVIENPFSVTVMLRRAGCPEAAPIGWEMDKDQWRSLQAEEVDICLPPEGILLLRDS